LWKWGSASKPLFLAIRRGKKLLQSYHVRSFALSTHVVWSRPVAAIPSHAAPSFDLPGHGAGFAERRAIVAVHDFNRSLEVGTSNPVQ
jgi:hypothetical protein